VTPAARPGGQAAGELLLVPRPQRLEVRGEGAPADTAVRTREVAELRAEGFQLEIGPDGIDLRHADENGLRYGLAFLEQIRDQSRGTLPGLFVDDWPDFPVRGYLLDISRDRVPTRATLQRLVELMALARINQFQLYTEHTFAYRDHEIVWRDASPITPDDVRWLDELCRAHGIELVPNQNTFGHMERWLKHDAYRHRAEAPDGFEVFPGIRRPAAVLEPTQDNADFALGLLDELLPNFTSRRVNVNGDEPFDLGHGASRAEVERRGKEAVYVEHMQRILQPLAAQGREVQIWADILRQNPALARELPDGVIPVAWTYEAPRSNSGRSTDGERARSSAAAEALARLGIDPAAHVSFASNVGPMAEAGVPFWVAPGTSGWRSLIGRIDNARANLLDAATVGREHGAGGYLITEWGDAGHWNPPSVTFGPIVFGGAVAWALDANSDLDLSAVVDRFVFGDRQEILGGVLETLGHAWRRTGMRSRNGSPLVDGLAVPRVMVGGEPDAAQLEPLLEDFEVAMTAIGRADPTSSDWDVVPHELTTAVRIARHATWRLLAQVGAPVPSAQALATDLDDVLALQKESWLQRSRIGGLSDSISGLRTTLAGRDGDS
jgi:hexosaminidase